MYLVHEELLISRLELATLQKGQVTIFDTPFMAVKPMLFSCPFCSFCRTSSYPLD
jgi:hypothetical protein